MHMNKVFLFSLIASLFSMTVFSQVSQEMIEYNKQKHHAFKMEYSYPVAVVEKTLLDRMEELGYRGKEEKGILNRDKGFVVHKGAFVSKINDKSMDYAFKIEPRNKKDKTGSVVYLVIMKDGANATSTFTDVEIDRVNSFLTDLIPDVETAHLEMQIKGQEESVVKSEKKLKSLQTDSLNLENKIRNLHLQLDKVVNDQVFQQKDIENQKKLLDEYKGKRKTQ